jgi:hypothetical protein
MCELNGCSGCLGWLLAGGKAAEDPVASRNAGCHESMPMAREVLDAFGKMESKK